MTIDEQAVIELARLAGLSLSASQLPGVTAYLQRTAQLAQMVNEFPLDAELDEPAPVWRP